MKTATCTFLLSFVLLVSSGIVFGQAPGWAWAKRGTGYGSDHGNKVAVDVYGNTYVIGSFYSDSIIFGSYTLKNVDHSGNFTDIFIVKYDVLGNVVWATGA